MSRRDEISDILLIGMSHKTAPVEVREHFTFEESELDRFYERAGRCGIGELVYLSTCNRVEIYYTAKDPVRASERLNLLLEDMSGVSRETFEQYAYRKSGREAVTHLLSVACSLDSMVIGETEILGQLKQAYRDSVHRGGSGLLLNRLFHQSFNTAKKVRTHTGIAQNPLSIAYIAVEKGKSLFGGEIQGKRALLVGAGEMGELILKYLTKNGIGGVIIANRTIAKAEAVAERINCSAKIVPLDQIATTTADADIVITSVTSHECIFSYDMALEISKQRRGRPLFIIDIAVPRNVDPAVADIEGMHLCNIDDLKNIADENLASRLSEVDAAMRIVQVDAAELVEWYEGLETVPLIAKLQESFNHIRERELDKYRRRELKHLSEEDFAVVDKLTKQIVSKILHNPIIAIKEQHAHDRDGYHDRDAIRKKMAIIEELFRL